MHPQPNMVMWEIFIPSAKEESLFDMIATATMCECDIVTISLNNTEIEWGHKSLNSCEVSGIVEEQDFHNRVHS